MRKAFLPWALATFAVLASTGTAGFAQQPPPSAEPVPPPAFAPPAPAGVSAPPSTITTGRVQRLLANPNGDVDGILLADGTQLSFPPRPVGQWRVAAGDTVRFEGRRVPGVPGAPVVRVRGLTAANGDATSFEPMPPGVPAGRPALAALNTSGRVARLLYTDRGDVNGALLDNGTVVRFPPHVGIAMTAALQPGQPLQARGWGTRGDLGTTMEATAMGSSADRLQDILAVQPPPPAADPAARRDRPAPPPPGGPAR